MPLIHDREYAQELQIVNEQLVRNSFDLRIFFPIAFTAIAVLVSLGLIFVGIENTPATIVGLCSGVTGAIGWAAFEIKRVIVLNISAVEWGGRKQLGEYEPVSK